MSGEIAILWSKIEGHLSEHAPSVLLTLNPPASPDEIERVATTLGTGLPQDLTEFLRIHNGQSDPSRLQLFTADGTFLSTSAMVETWRTLTQIDQSLSKSVPIRHNREWWSAEYLPLTDYEGDHLCIDLSAGAKGEILMHVHDGQIERRLFPSFTAWLRKVESVFRQNRFAIDEGFT